MALFRPLVEKLSRFLGRRELPPEELAYRRLKRKGFAPGSIIDVGAYEGNWTRLVRRVFPEVPIVMVEAQPSKRPYLDQVCGELEGTRAVTALLGARTGLSVPFYEMETGSSMFPERSNVPRRVSERTTVTLDEIAGSLPSPIFLKIDVQGAELDVLNGGGATLRQCEVVQLEMAVLPYNDGAPTMLEVMSYMAGKGFVPLDISGFSRPNGIDLVQIDMLFAPLGSKLRTQFFEF